MKLVKIDGVLDKLYRNPLFESLTREAAADYASDFMEITGTAGIDGDKIAVIKISEHKAKLPDDFYKINEIRDNKTQETYVQVSSAFHNSKNNKGGGLRYKIQGSYIFVEKKETEIEISYKSIKVDEDGMPLIPESAFFSRALMSYIKKEFFLSLLERNKISGIAFQLAQQEYAWAVGALQAELNRMSTDKMRHISSIINSI